MLNAGGVNVVMYLNLRDLASKSEPYFHNGIVSRFGDIYKETLFHEASNIIENTSVNLDEVVGHSQPYDSMTWGSMLSGVGLKRMGSDLRELEENPSYYIDEHPKKDWEFIRVDDKYFISEGKHRTTIAKYFSHYNQKKFPNGPIVHGVTVIHRFIDVGVMGLIEEIRNQLSQDKFSHINITMMRDSIYSRNFKIYVDNKMIKNEGGLIYTAEELGEFLNLLKTTSVFKQFSNLKGHKALRRFWWI